MDEGRYRAAEARLWSQVGRTPVEHRIHLRRNDVTVRVQELGDGPAVLFLHGGPGTTGPVFADLAARLPGLRCLLLDRPGTGLSDPHPLDGPAAVRREGETLVADVLDAFELDRAHLVGSSHGSYVAIHAAATYPDRVGRTVHLGCPGFVEGMRLTASDRVVLLPGVHRVLARLPMNERGMLATMRQLGHDRAVDTGELPPWLVDWSVALLRHTDTMRNELATMASMGSFRRGFDPSLTIGPELLARVASPTSVLWGDADPYGDVDVARRLVSCLPEAELEVLPGAGHLCWLDDVDRAAHRVVRHLLGRPATQPTGG